MKEFAQVLVVLVIGLPFVYMAVDVTIDIISRISKKSKPVLIRVVTTITNLMK
jgi:hypothetical protein